MKVQKVMSTSTFTCSEQDACNQAAQVMWEHDCGFLPVIDHTGTLRGVVTDRDLLMGAYTRGRPLWEIAVSDVMSARPHVCSPDDDLSDVERMMQAAQIRRAPVVDAGGRLVGVISLADLARSAQAGVLNKGLMGPAVAKTLAAICSPRSSESSAAE